LAHINGIIITTNRTYSGQLLAHINGIRVLSCFLGMSIEPFISGSKYIGILNVLKFSELRK
jgi:hypothetical protein